MTLLAVTVEDVLLRLEVVIAIIVILSSMKSGYNGLLRELIRNVQRIPNIEDKAEQIESKQEDMADAIVLIGHSQANEHVEPDPAALEEDLRDGDDGPARYSRDGSLYRGGSDAPSRSDDD